MDRRGHAAAVNKVRVPVRRYQLDTEGRHETNSPATRGRPDSSPMSPVGVDLQSLLEHLLDKRYEGLPTIALLAPPRCLRRVTRAGCSPAALAVTYAGSGS